MKIRVYFKIYEKHFVIIYMVVNDEEVYFLKTTNHITEKVFKKDKVGKIEVKEVPLKDVIIRDIVHSFSNRDTTVYWYPFTEKTIFDETYYEFYHFEATQKKLNTRVTRHNFEKLTGNRLEKALVETKAIQDKIERYMQSRIEEEEKQMKELEIKIESHDNENHIEF